MATVYEIITNRIVEQLDKGVVPWRKPWATSRPVNYVTGKPYNGINLMLLDAGEYATYNQINKAGGQVIQGSKGSIVVFYKAIEKENPEDLDEDGNPTKKIKRILRYSTVFKIGEQTTGLELKHTNKEKNVKVILSGEQVSKDYLTKENIKLSTSNEASYSPTLDDIKIPAITSFDKSESYYATLFHEMVHSTGHESRLNREIKNGFGSEKYSKEELVAEMGSAFLCAETGIEPDIENSSAYIAAWKQRLQDDSYLIVCASKYAQKAVKFILNQDENKKEGGKI